MTECFTKEAPYVRRDFKDTLFRLIFREKESLLSLYNAVNNTDYTNPDDLEIVTLENAIYMDMKNDVAFVLYDELHLYEHQSTPNPNMPLRDLFYISREYEKLLAIPENDNLQRSVYSTRKLEIPTPRFMMFYNGRKDEPEYHVQRLSELYRRKDIEFDLELKVHMFNINFGMNRDLMERCKKLADYAKYVDRVRKYAILLPIEEAVERAVQECIAEGILADLLTGYRREVIQMSIFEFDAEREWAIIRRDERLNAMDELREQVEEQYKAENEQRMRKLCEEVSAENRARGHAEGHAEGRAEGRVEGALHQMFQLVRKNLLSAEIAAAEMGMTEAEFIRKMRETEAATEAEE